MYEEICNQEYAFHKVKKGLMKNKIKMAEICGCANDYPVDF